MKTNNSTPAKKTTAASSAKQIERSDKAPHDIKEIPKVEPDSIQWTGSNTEEVLKFGVKKVDDVTELEKVRLIEDDPERLSVETLLGFEKAEKGNYINKDSNGNLTLESEETHNEKPSKK